MPSGTSAQIPGQSPSWRGLSRRGAALWNTDTEYKVRQRNKRAAGRIKARQTVLMVLLLAFWRWLLPAPAMQAPSATPASPAAPLAVRGSVPLAPIPAPLRRLLS
jgi:hypothetical protein